MIGAKWAAVAVVAVVMDVHMAEARERHLRQHPYVEIPKRGRPEATRAIRYHRRDKEPPIVAAKDVLTMKTKGRPMQEEESRLSTIIRNVTQSE